jgi:putative NIF3 family GTP cyclohydrolase 1 type 2
MTPRWLLLLAAVAVTSASGAPRTARQILDEIKTQTGVQWREQTVDTIKAGDPDTQVTGIATTMFATFDVLKRAAADGKNLVIAHEPTFYSHQDTKDALRQANDPVWAEKEKFIADHKMVVFRFHDHWHMRRPDGVQEGMTRALGWQKYQNAGAPNFYTLPETTLSSLASTIREKLKIRTLRVVGDPQLKATKIALMPGAAGSARQIPVLRRDDVEVLIIGEVPEWETVLYAADASFEGRRKALILMGHTPSEQAGMENCAAWLKTFIRDVPVAYIPADEFFWMPK